MAGIAGLLAAANPQATMAEIRSAILDSVVRVPSLAGRSTTGGRVNAAAATVRAQADGSALDSFLRLFDSTGRQLLSNDDFGGSLDSRLNFQATAAGTYYVGVSGYGNSGYSPVTGSGTAAGSTGAYAVRLSRASPPLEPNDSLAQATAVVPQAGAASFSATVGDGAQAASDVDLFRVALAAGQSLTMDIAARTIGSQLDSFLRLFDSTGRELARNDDHDGSLDSYLVFTAPAAGTYFVGVSGYGNAQYLPATAGSGRAGSTGTYRLDLGFTAAPQPPAPPTASVVGRHVFYNGSAFDGANPAANAADDAAIATDKRPLRPGQTASFANYTSYVRGITGVMVDIAGLVGTPTVADFGFRTRAAGTGTAWVAGPAPQSLALRPGAGVNGSTRITFTWPEGAIRNAWLEG